MTDRPILFSGPMVRALLDGRKTQTRRLVKGVDPEEFGHVWGTSDLNGAWEVVFSDYPGDQHIARIGVKCPYGVPGDRLWVRESCWIYGQWHEAGRTPTGRRRWRFKTIGEQVLYANPRESGLQIAHLGGGPGWSYRNSIHMPRWASRLTLTLTDVRVQRLQEIGVADAIAEGLFWRAQPINAWAATDDPNWPCFTDPTRAFAGLWDHVNGESAWQANPWVWALTFDVAIQNIDGGSA